MGKNGLIFDEFAVERLRYELSQKVGWKISNKLDCIRLAELISSGAFGAVSDSTLYRLFFMQEKHKPYKHTLDIICRFIGYQDSLAFLEKIEKSRKQLHANGVYMADTSGKSLIFYCLEHQSTTVLKDFFEAVDEMPMTFKMDLGVSVFDSLLKSTKQVWFFDEFSNNAFIRRYFFDKLHDPKFRIPHYDHGLLRYMESNRDGKVSDPESDFLFVHSVLFRYYFLSKQMEKAWQYGRLLYQEHKSMDVYDPDAMFIWPFIRFVCYRLWYLEMNKATKQEKEGYALYLLELCEQTRAKLSLRIEHNIIVHTLAETFINSGLPVSFHRKLKQVFAADFHRLPASVLDKHLRYCLPYFDENTILHFRQ
jgi:hypothetical protein